VDGTRGFTTSPLPTTDDGTRGERRAPAGEGGGVESGAIDGVGEGPTAPPEPAVVGVVGSAVPGGGEPGSPGVVVVGVAAPEVVVVVSAGCVVVVVGGLVVVVGPDVVVVGPDVVVVDCAVVVVVVEPAVVVVVVGLIVDDVVDPARLVVVVVAPVAAVEPADAGAAAGDAPVLTWAAGRRVTAANAFGSTRPACVPGRTQAAAISRPATGPDGSQRWITDRDTPPPRAIGCRGAC
jgi:hypothetical protein